MLQSKINESYDIVNDVFQDSDIETLFLQKYSDNNEDFSGFLSLISDSLYEKFIVDENEYNIHTQQNYGYGGANPIRGYAYLKLMSEYEQNIEFKNKINQVAYQYVNGNDEKISLMLAESILQEYGLIEKTNKNGTIYL